MLLLAAMIFVVQVGVAVMLPLLPLYAQSLGAAPFVLGLLTSIFAVTNAFGQLITGFLAERIEMRRLLAGGIGSYAVANFLIALASTAGVLVAFRAFAGLGGGVMLIGERLYLAQLVDQGRLAFANGILSAAGSAGSVAGPAIGGLVASAFADLRLPFIVVGVTSLVATIASFFLPRTGVGGAAVRAGAATAAAGPAAAGVADARPRGALSGGRLRVLGLLLLVQLALNAGFGAFITTYGPFADARLGWTIAEIGFVFALFGIGSILFGPWLSRQADVRGRRDVAIVGTFPVLVFCVGYWLEQPWPVLYLISIAAGAGVTTVGAAWYALLAKATEGGRQSRQFGVIAALSNLGIVVGATVSAELWQSTGDVRVGFVVAGVSTVVCAAALLGLPRDRPAVATTIDLA